MSLSSFQFKASLLNKSISFYNFIQAFEWYSVLCYKSFLFQINADLWIFLFIKESRKKYSTVLNIDNNNNNNNNNM